MVTEHKTSSQFLQSRGKWFKESKKNDYHDCTHLQLVHSGYEYFELLESLIRSAQHVIHLQTYIFEKDNTGKRVAKALEEAAMRGVKVYLVVDGYASQGLSAGFIRRLEQAGVNFRYFDPLLKSKYFYFGRRLHHKVVTIDDQHGLVGGINISNNYNDTVNEPAWLDWALYIQGSLASDLRLICERRAKGFERRISLSRKKRVATLVNNKTVVTGVDVVRQVRIRINDWVRRKREITASYFQMFRQAKSHVTIMSSYFLPGKELKRQMSLAAKRGVRIRVVMGHHSDVSLSRHAERYMYRWLLRNNIEIYEYLPRIVHSKLALYDSQWLTVGSYNVNNISAYASIELNLEVRDVDFVKKVERQLDRIIELDCVLITEEDYNSHTTWFDKFIQRSAYDIFRIMLFIFTFYFKQRE